MLVTTKSSNSKILAIVIFLALFCTTALYPNVQAENHGVSLRIIEKTGDSEREHVYLLNKYPLEKITVEATGNILTVNNSKTGRRRSDEGYSKIKLLPYRV